MKQPGPGTCFPTVGILGGGQLGRMTALAAIRMGLRVRFLVPKPSGSIRGLGKTMVGDWRDEGVLAEFAAGCDRFTVESEWAPADLLARILPPEKSVWPSPDTLRLIRNKGVQKTTLAKAGLPVPAFSICSTFEEARMAAREFGFPCLLKRLEGSYDGYGNATVRSNDTLIAAWERLAGDGGALVEAWAPFVRELSVIVARRPGGESVVYPVVWTEQRDHRCHAVVAPAPVSPDVEAHARAVGIQAVETVGGVGITAVELFEMADGAILVNELAPRPHNTGHYSIEACYASQFENHVRAVLDWPLGDPSLRVPAAAMVNVIGRRDGTPTPDGYTEALAVPGVSVHLYGKRRVRPGRKMGHVTVTGDDAGDVLARAEQAAALIHL